MLSPTARTIGEFWEELKNIICDAKIYEKKMAKRSERSDQMYASTIVTKNKLFGKRSGNSNKSQTWVNNDVATARETAHQEWQLTTKR